jgi:multicomponent Na+:H+ antiporter subunit F
MVTLESIANWFALPGLVFVIGCALYRLIKGPHFPDRVVAIDLMASVGIGIVAVYALATEDVAVFDIALVIALLSFLGTVAFAYYLERNR